MITKKERVASVLQHKIPDRLPSQTNFTGVVKKLISAHFSISQEDVDDFFDNHLLRLDLTYQKQHSADDKICYDWWGAGFDTSEEGYHVCKHPLAEPRTMEDYSWPDPGNATVSGIFSGAAKAVKNENNRKDPRFIIPNFGFALFERAWSLRGMEQFMMDLALEPIWTEKLLERITEIQVSLARGFVNLGVDGGYFGDDLGAQRGLLFSPETWRQIFKPRLKRMFEIFTDNGLPVIMHSDGDIKEIIPDLLDIGLSCLNPCQPEVLDHHWLKKEFGKDLAFYGGLSTQGVLPKGRPKEVRSAARRCLETLASDGTGLIFGPSHRMMSDIPMENIEALLESLPSRVPD